MIRKAMKRTLSVVLALTLVLTTFLIFDPTALFPKAEAATAGSELALWAPEVIYLYPDALSFKQNSAAPFEYYVNNTSTGAVSTTYNETTGKIYWSYPKATGTVSISYRFVDQYMGSALSGGSVTLGATSNLGTSKTISITAGTSPSLAYNVTCCYIEWCVSFTDSADNVAKKAYAYTCVYKPYVTPLVGGIRCEYDSGYAGSIGWLSGFQGVKEMGSNWTTAWEDDNNASGESRTMGYAKWTGSNGMAGFISKNNKAYIGTTEVTNGKTCRTDIGTITYASGATKWYAVYNGQASSTAHLNTTANNSNADNWYSTSQNDSSTFKAKSFQYNNANGDDYCEVMMHQNAQAKIRVDTSRYSNLKDIPNLAIGLFVCDDQGSGGTTGGWYVASYTGRNGRSNRDGCDSAKTARNLNVFATRNLSDSFA